MRKKGYSPTPGSPQCAQARYVEPGPSRPHVGLLFRVWATPPMYGTGGPRAGQAARVRNRRPACERRGAALHQARCNARKPAMWSLGLLIRTWACCSESGQPRPCTGQTARVRNRRPACGTRWSPSCFVQVPVGGGPPARSPHASLRLGVVDLEARPGPAAAPGHQFRPGYRSRPFCSLRNLAGVVVACAKQPQCLTGVESQNDRKCAGDGSFYAR